MEIKMYSHNNNYPVKNLPHRIILANGMSKTDSATFTEEDIEYAGYRFVEDPPAYDNKTQRLIWTIENGVGVWKILDIPQEQLWEEVRIKRNKLMNDFEWRILRYNREVTIGLPITDNDIQGMHTYMQALADITKQEDPLNIVWPVYHVDHSEE